MSKTLVSMMLPLLQLLVLMDGIILLTSAKDTVQVVSFRKAKTTQNGPIKCALDPANETISSSSLEDCSLRCAHDLICASFNIKDSKTCDLYKYKAKVLAPFASCFNYQVTVKEIFFMVALCNRETIYIFILFLLLLLLLLFFSSPNLSSRRLDVYHTSAHGVVLV